MLNWMTSASSSTAAILLACALAAGCATPPSDTMLVSPPPASYREIVAARLGPVYDEAIIPTNAEISSPFQGRSRLGASSTICVRAPIPTAESEIMPTAELKIVAVTFRTNEIVGVDFRFAPTHCANAVYEPFPELQAHYKEPAPGVKAARLAKIKAKR